jgi:pyrimidine deaminase RibD-like protein
MKHDKFLNLAFQIAQEVPRVGNASIAALVVYKNTVVAIGANQPKTHPFMAKFKSDPWHEHPHAETNAILKAIKTVSLKKLKKCVLYVCRAKIDNGTYVWGMSKPCDSCNNALQKFPVKTCIYSTDITGEYASLNVR